MTINWELKLKKRKANDIKMQNCVAWETDRSTTALETEHWKKRAVTKSIKCIYCIMYINAFQINFSVVGSAHTLH